MIYLLLSDVVLHVCLSHIHIRLIKLVLFVLLHLQLLHRLELVQLEFAADRLGISLPLLIT